MNKEQIMLKMDKLYSKLELYVRKSESMGLEEEEEDKYYQLFAEYLKLKLRLGDLIFDKYILSAINYGTAAKLKMEMLKDLKWNSDLLVDDEQMEPVLTQYESIKDKKEIEDKIENYYVELMINVDKYLADSKNDVLVKEVVKLLSSAGNLVENGEKSDINDVIRDHIDYKFEVLYMLISEGECNEETY